MPAPQAVPSSVPGGVGLYYVPPSAQPPNIVAAFWHNYLATRSPYAQASFKATLAAQSPKDQYAALAAIAKARQAMMAEEGKNSRSSQQAAVAAMQQAHADYRSRTAAGASIESSQIRGNATMGSAKYGYDAARLKAGTIDPSTGGRVVADFRTRSEAAQRALADALDAGDEAGAREASVAYQQAVANARDATSQLNDPLQEDAVARELQGMPMLVSDPDVQDALHKTITGSFGVSREPPIEDLGGVGGSLKYEEPPSLDIGPQSSSSSSSSTKRSESIATRMRGPVTTPSAGPPGSSPASLPSPTTSGGNRSRAEGQPSGTGTSPSSASSSSASRSRDPGAEARSSAGDPFSDLEERVTASRSTRPNPADFNFYGRGFGVFGDGKEARKAPPTRGRARAEQIADSLAERSPEKTAPKTEPAPGMVDPYSRRQAPVNEPGTFRPNLSGKTVATPIRSEIPPKVMELEQKPAAPGPAKPAGAPKASASRHRASGPPKSPAPPPGAPAAPQKPAASGTARPGGGAGDVKVAESRASLPPEQPKPGAGAGDVKVAEARQDAGVFGRGGELDQRMARGVAANVALGAQTVGDAMPRTMDVARRIGGKGGLLDQAVDELPTPGGVARGVVDAVAGAPGRGLSLAERIASQFSDYATDKGDNIPADAPTEDEETAKRRAAYRASQEARR